MRCKFVPFLISSVLIFWVSGSWAATPYQPNIAALVMCKQRVSDFARIFPYSQDPLKSLSLGWRPLKRINPFMTEYILPQTITVFGYSTRHIAFSGGSIIAILDMPNPHPLAKKLQLTSALDTPQKVLYGREILSRDTKDPQTGKPVIESIVLNLSTVHSHPGKTLVGCNYSFDDPELEKDDAKPSVQH